MVQIQLEEDRKGLVYKNQFHIIFCPKYRRPVLVDGVDVRLKEILFSVAAEHDAEIKAMANTNLEKR